MKGGTNINSICADLYGIDCFLPRWVLRCVLAEAVLGGVLLGPGDLAVGLFGAAGFGLGAGFVVGCRSNGT